MIAGISDYFTLKIPNWLNLIIAVSVIPFVLLAQMPMELFAWHVVAGLLTFIVAFVLFAVGIIGGGDAKMLSACALWVGWDAMFNFTMYTVIAGGILGLALTVWKWLASKKDDAGFAWAKGLGKGKQQLPYGIAIAAAGVIVFPATWWVQQIS